MSLCLPWMSTSHIIHHAFVHCDVNNRRQSNISLKMKMNCCIRCMFTIQITIMTHIPGTISIFLTISIFCILTVLSHIYTGCFKKSFTTLKAYRNLYRGHIRFELSKRSKTHRVLPRIVIRNCYTIPFMHVVL